LRPKVIKARRWVLSLGRSRKEREFCIVRKDVLRTAMERLAYKIMAILKAEFEGYAFG